MNLETIQNIWKEVIKSHKEQPFEPFCEKLDEQYQDSEHNLYVRILWWSDTRDEMCEELLELGQRFLIKEYIIFRDDVEECTVIVARHRRYDEFYDGSKN